VKIVQRPVGRSLGVTLIAVLLAINGLVALASALLTLGTTGGTDVASFIGVLFGLALLYLAYGVWTLQGWAWLTTLLLEIVNLIFDLILVVAAPGTVSAWIGLILAAVIVFYLTRPSIRAEFGGRRVGF
jgi:hypothetical protein